MKIEPTKLEAEYRSAYDSFVGRNHWKTEAGPESSIAFTHLEPLSHTCNFSQQGSNVALENRVISICFVENETFMFLAWGSKTVVLKKGKHFRPQIIKTILDYEEVDIFMIKKGGTWHSVKTIDHTYWQDVISINRDQGYPLVPTLSHEI